METTVLGFVKHCGIQNNFDQMVKSELKTAKVKINETKNLLLINQEKLQQIDNLIVFQNDSVNLMNIGEIVNSDLAENFYEAEQLFQRNQFEKAIESLNKVTEINDAYADAYHIKGQCFEKLNKKEQAIQCYDKAIENKHIRAHNLKAFLLTDKKEAKILFEKALELNKNPICDQELAYQGESYLGLNKYQDAIFCFERSIEMNPNNTQAIRYRGVCFEKMEKYKSWIDTLEK